jgi:hypothetical protein
MSINEFIAHATRNEIEIPQFFMDILDDAAGRKRAD